MHKKKWKAHRLFLLVIKTNQNHPQPAKTTHNQQKSPKTTHNQPKPQKTLHKFLTQLKGTIKYRVLRNTIFSVMLIVGVDLRKIWNWTWKLYIWSNLSCWQISKWTLIKRKLLFCSKKNQNSQVNLSLFFLKVICTFGNKLFLVSGNQLGENVFITYLLDWLWVVVGGYGWLWVAVGSFGWFWLVVFFITNRLFQHTFM